MDERNPSASLPCPSALGATWDPALVRALAAALGTEAKSKGVDILLAPTINVMRTPLGGRGFESFGKDPVLISRLAVAFVCGLHQAGAAAAVEHYVGNDSETQRWTYDARIAEHVLRELYLAPFEACVREADVDLVMTGYNKVNARSSRPTWSRRRRTPARPVRVLAAFAAVTRRQASTPRPGCAVRPGPSPATTRLRGGGSAHRASSSSASAGHRLTCHFTCG